MASETMSPAERVACALAFEKPDRVPVVPKVVKSTCVRYCGVPQAKAELDIEIALECMLKFYDDIGGWDAIHCDVPDVGELHVAVWEAPLTYKRPGVDLPEDAMLQCHEYEVMKLEDYDRLIAEGWQRFYYEDYLYRIFPFEPGEVPTEVDRLNKFAIERCAPEWEKRGVEPYMQGLIGLHPFFSLSLMRSLNTFTHDLYDRPEIVEKAIKSMGREQMENAIAFIKKNKPRSMLLVDERASYYPPAIFERFWWPYVHDLIDATWAEGVVVYFHLDTDWGKKLPYFKQLPRGSYVLQLDSLTDMVAAKEQLPGAMFDGDVSASLQVLGTPEEIEAYVKNIIDKVGYEGGFFLSTGCETPMECRFENMKTLVDTGKTYELSRK